MSEEVSLLSLIQAGLVLGATLSWSNVIQASAEYVWPHNDKAQFRAQLAYSIILTLIVLLIFYFIEISKSRLMKIKDEIILEQQKLSSKF